MAYYEGVRDVIVPTMPMDAGPLPTLVRYLSATKEIRGVVAQAREAVRTQPVAIICPKESLLEKIVAELRRVEEERVRLITKDLRWARKPQIYVATYHNAKGLEFDSVILPFMSSDHMPVQYTCELYGRENAMTAAGSWLYVGITRARRNLIITYNGKLSALLPDDRGREVPLYTRRDVA
jgi:superfamily I DNA/RNA helicase